MDELKLKNPALIVSQFVPMGRNHMISFNRHIGAHKKYKAPTEFGLRGAVKEISIGNFQMDKEGVLLSVEDYDFSRFAKVLLRSFENQDQIFSMKLDEDGLSYLGAKLPTSSLTFDEAKIILGKIAYKVTDYLYPVLADIQQDLLAALYGCEDTSNLLESPYVTPSYALVICESIEHSEEVSSSKEFLEKHPRKIDAITDWIITDETIDKAHIFIGMRAAVCIGEPSDQLKTALEIMLFLKSMFNCSLRLFSMIWTLSKKTKQMKEDIAKAGYNDLKQIEQQMTKTSSQLTLIKVLDKTFQDAIQNKQTIWDTSKAKKNFPENIFNIDTDFQDELIKAEDRDLTIEILSADVETLQGLVNQRIDLILTRNSENLNLLVLLFTLVSLVGIGEAMVFQQRQWIAVIIALVPFTFALVIYLFNYFRNFVRRKKR